MDAQATPYLRIFERQDVHAPSLAGLREELAERIASMISVPDAGMFPSGGLPVIAVSASMTSAGKPSG